MDETFYVVQRHITKSRLEIAPRVFMEFNEETPCFWFRIWQRIFLGWKWTKIKES